MTDAYRLVAESSPDVLLLLDRRLSIVYANGNAAIFTGHPARDLIGRTWEDVAPPQTARASSIAMAAIFESGIQGIAEYELDGMWIECRRTPILAADGHVEYLLVIIRSVSERHRMEQELRDQTQRYRTLAENTHDIIMRFDRAHRHLYVSPSVSLLVDMKPEAFIGKTHRDLGFPADKAVEWEQAIDRAFESGEVQISTFDFDGRQGRVTFDWRLYPERDVDGRMQTVLSSARDITDFRRAENALRDKLAEAELLNRLVTGREFRVIDLKREVNALLKRLGEPPRYQSGPESSDPS